jgi:hypothetical protein
VRLGLARSPAEFLRDALLLPLDAHQLAREVSNLPLAVGALRTVSLLPVAGMAHFGMKPSRPVDTCEPVHSQV